MHGLDLSVLREPEDVLQALAESLRTPDPATVIGDGRWLLVLDSFEHVAAAATAVAALLAGCPRLTVLATSRSPLRLRGEHLWPLTPLSTPDSDDPAALAGNTAVELLVERTAAVRPGFTLTADNAAAVAALCRRLDGLPLALELAAARLRTQAPSQVLAQVRDLHGDTVDLADRHLSLRHTVEWSTRGLTDPDRRLFGLLGAFAGGADPVDVEAVFGARRIRWRRWPRTAWSPSRTGPGTPGSACWTPSGRSWRTSSPARAIGTSTRTTSSAWSATAIRGWATSRTTSVPPSSTPSTAAPVLAARGDRAAR